MEEMKKKASFQVEFSKHAHLIQPYKAFKSPKTIFHFIQVCPEKNDMTQVLLPVLGVDVVSFMST